jgi:DNA polymerase-3 subunit delta
MVTRGPKRVSAEQLAGALARGLAPLYVVVGAEPLLGFEACDRILAAARQAGYLEREVLTVEQGFDWSRLALAASTDSLFGDRRVLELRIPGGKPGVEGARALEGLAARLGDTMVVLVSLPGLEPASLRSKWFSALAEAGTLVQTEVVTRERLPAWIQGRLAAQGHQVSPESLMLLSERTEGNLLAAFQEVQKLALLFPPGPLPEAAVREAVMDVARFDIDELASALLAREAARYERTLRGLQEGGEALPLIVWSLAESLRGLVRAASALAQGRALPQAVREARVWGARQGLIERQVQRIPLDLARAALLQVAQVDRASKGLDGNSDPWDELLALGLRFMQATADRRGMIEH